MLLQFIRTGCFVLSVPLYRAVKITIYYSPEEYLYICILVTSNIHVCKTRNRRNHILSTSFGDNSNRIQVLFRFKLVFTITKFFLPVYTPIMELDLREYAVYCTIKRIIISHAQSREI